MVNELVVELEELRCRVDRLLALAKADGAGELAEVVPLRGGGMTVREWWEKWPGSHRPAWSPDSRRHNLGRTRRFVEAHGDLPIDGVGESLAREWGEAHPGEVRYLRAMFNAAVRGGFCSSSPFLAARLPRSRSRKQDPVPTQQEVELLARKALELWPGVFGRTMRTAVLVGAYSALRQKEMLSIEASGVKRARVWIRGKGGRDRKIVVLGPGRAALRELGRERPAGPLFRGKAGRPLSATRLKEAWYELRAACGMSYEWHMLRHACATWLLDAGAQEKDVAWLLHGHPDTRELKRTYDHSSADAALDRLEAVGL